MKAPRRNSVGCSPTEKISRRIMDAIKARMPWGLGSAMTMARDRSMAVHSSPDQCGSRVPGKTRRVSPSRAAHEPRAGPRRDRALLNPLGLTCPNSRLQLCAPDTASTPGFHPHARFAVFPLPGTFSPSRSPQVLARTASPLGPHPSHVPGTPPFSSFSVSPGRPHRTPFSRAHLAPHRHRSHACPVTKTQTAPHFAWGRRPGPSTPRSHWQRPGHGRCRPTGLFREGRRWRPRHRLLQPITPGQS